MTHDTATQAVGVWQDITGGSTRHIDYLQTKIQDYITALDQSSLPRDLVWTRLRRAVWRSILYGSPTVSLSKKQSH